MLRLPHHQLISRGPLRAFAITLSAFAGGVAAATAPPGRRALAGALVGAAGSLPVLVRPQLAQRPYRAWDRGAEQVARAATTYVSWVTYWTAVVDRPPPTSGRGAPVGGAWLVASMAADTEAGVGDRWLDLCLATLRWVRPSDLPPDFDVPTDVYTLY